MTDRQFVELHEFGLDAVAGRDRDLLALARCVGQALRSKKLCVRLGYVEVESNILRSTKGD